jgi:nucleoside-diphosphate-sugar epimerase
MKSTVLVTGAAGFIGSNLCGRLIGEGYVVRGLDDLSEGSLDNLSSFPEVDLVEGDLRSWDTVNRVARDCQVVFHLGAIRSVPRSLKDPSRTMEVNLVGCFNVLRAAYDHGMRVVFASSSSVYGDQDKMPLSEDLRPKPKSPYAGSKLMGEIYLETWWRAFSVPTLALRYFNVYGPRQDPESEYAAVVPRFILGCLGEAGIEIHGDGEQARDFTYVDDVVEANILAASAPQRAWGKSLNVGGGQLPTSINRLFEIVAGLTGNAPQPTYLPSRPGDVRRTHADLTLAQSLIGYRAKTTIEVGLKNTLEWFRSQASRPT